MKTPRQLRQGFALVFVLWAVAIASLIAAIVLPAARTASRVARQDILSAQSEAAAEAVTARAILALLDPRRDHRWRVDGVPTQFDFDGHTYEVSIQDQFGLIDLNAASRDALHGLLSSTKLSPADVDRETDLILDWRDDSGLHRVNGLDPSANQPSNQKRGGFASVDELRLVPGITGTLYDELAPALTIYSGSSSINPATAPMPVLRSLPGYDEQRARSEIAARSAQSDVSVGPVAAGIIDPQISTAGWSFQINVTCEKIGKSHDTIDTIIRLTGDPQKPYWILYRRLTRNS